MPLHFRRPFRRLVSTRRSLRTGCLITLLASAGVWLFFACSGPTAPIGQMLGVSTGPAVSPNGTEIPGPASAGLVMPSEIPTSSQAGPPADSGTEEDTAQAGEEPTPEEPGAEFPVEALPPTATAMDALALLRGRPSVPVSDLLFIAGNQLLLWQRRSQQVKVLAQSPEAFVASSDGAVILSLHSRSITVNGSDRYDLMRVDPSTGSQSLIIENTPLPQMLTMTANGRWAAFALGGDRTLVYTLELAQETASNKSESSTTPVPAPTAVSPTVDPTATRAQGDTSSSGAASSFGVASPIGACEALPEERCGSLAWSPDGRSLAWSDGRGVWLADALTRAVRQVHDLRVQVADPKDQVSEYDAHFDRLVWSPDGRFLLLRVIPKDSSVMWWAVLDARSGKLASATDSFAVEEADSRVEWLANDRIAVAHGSDLVRSTPPFIHIWNVFATNPKLLVSGEQYDVYSEEFPFSPQSSKSIPAHQIDWLSALIPGKILFGVKLPDTQTQPVLFTLDLTTGKIVKVHTLPEGTERVDYALDHSGALVGGSGGFAFAPLTGEEIIDLSRVFSLNISQLKWLTPNLPRRP